MKNKHLVLLFIATIIIGLALRHLPWRSTDNFQKNLLPADSSQIVRMELGDLTLIRTETGWAAEQKNRSARVPEALIQPMLAALSPLRSIRIVPTQQPDSFGLSGQKAIAITIYYAENRTEHLRIGQEILDQGKPATYILLPRHEGVYLVENALRSPFTKSFDDIRKAAVVDYHTTDVHAFSIETLHADSQFFTYNPQNGRWQSENSVRSISNDSVFAWLSRMEKLPQLPFADLFDETHGGKQLFSRISLSLNGIPEPLWVNIYRLNTLSMPEELPDLKPNDPRLAPYALYFSPYPTNYYALSDTIFLRQICQPF